MGTVRLRPVTPLAFDCIDQILAVWVGCCVTVKIKLIKSIIIVRVDVKIVAHQQMRQP